MNRIKGILWAVGGLVAVLLGWMTAQAVMGGPFGVLGIDRRSDPPAPSVADRDPSLSDNPYWNLEPDRDPSLSDNPYWNLEPDRDPSLSDNPYWNLEPDPSLADAPLTGAPWDYVIVIQVSVSPRWESCGPHARHVRRPCFWRKGSGDRPERCGEWHCDQGEQSGLPRNGISGRPASPRDAYIATSRRNSERPQNVRPMSAAEVEDWERQIKE